MMNGSDRIIGVTSYLLHIMENPGWYWLKYIKVHLSCKRNLKVANPELVWWVNGGSSSVFLLCSTCFQPQSHLKVQHGCWSSSHHVHFPGSRKEEGPKRYSSQVNWFTSRDFLRSPVQHSVYILWSARIPLVFELKLHWIYNSIWEMLAP